MELILASNSPRRKQLLSELGVKFSVIVSDFSETNFTNDPIITAETFAIGKAKDVFNNLPNKNDKLVLGADTVVYFDGEILGKPKDHDDAYAMLKKLSDKEHIVVTGFALVGGDFEFVGHDVTFVRFNRLSKEQILDYVKTGLPFGKAGSYGIQDGFNLVKSYIGSLNNVIGLPTEKILKLLKNYSF